MAFHNCGVVVSDAITCATCLAQSRPSLDEPMKIRRFKTAGAHGFADDAVVDAGPMSVCRTWSANASANASARYGPARRLPCGQLRRRNAERERDLPKPRLDHASVPRSHAQELPLGGAQLLEPFVGVRVTNAFRFQPRRRVEDGRLEERDDGAGQRAIEGGSLDAELAVRLLDPGFERSVQFRRRRRID